MRYLMKSAMYVENANRASQDAVITPDRYELLKKEGKSKGTYYVLQNKGE